MTFIDRLLSLMNEKNITAYRLAKDTGISESIISKWQKNSSIEPSSLILFKLSEYFQVSMEWLLTGERENGKSSQADGTDSLTQDLEEHLVGRLSLEEKLLIENYRDMVEKDKIEIQRRIAYKLSAEKTRSALMSTNGDVEISDEMA